MVLCSCEFIHQRACVSVLMCVKGAQKTKRKKVGWVSMGPAVLSFVRENSGCSNRSSMVGVVDTTNRSNCVLRDYVESGGRTGASRRTDTQRTRQMRSHTLQIFVCCLLIVFLLISFNLFFSIDLNQRKRKSLPSQSNG